MNLLRFLVPSARFSVAKRGQMDYNSTAKLTNAGKFRRVQNTILYEGGSVFMQKDQQKLEQLIKGKKVAFIGAGVSHKTLI